MWLGISTDELKRVRDTQRLSRGRVRENYYPLIEMRLSRADCIALLKEFDIPMPKKSACDICPFSTKKRLVERLAIDPTLYTRIKHIESQWHENPKNVERYLTMFLDKLPTQEEAIKMVSMHALDTDNSGACGVCEF